MKKLIDCNRNRLKITKVLVVDKDNKPMTWDGKQFCYAELDRRFKFWAEVYTLRQANAFIKKAHTFRRKHLYDVFEYFLLPVYVG